MPCKVLFIDSTHPSLKEGLEKIGVICSYIKGLSYEKVKEIIREYDGVVIRSKINIDKAIIDATTNLKFIARVGAGLENIDVAYAESKGVKCINSPEGNRDAVGEHAIGMLLALFNNICRSDSQVRQGEWIREDNRGVELKGKTVGIIGYGNMGSAFAKKLSGFEVKTIAYDKYKFNYSDKFVKESSLNDLFENSDIVSLHIPLTKETNYMVNDEFINSFRKNIYLINTARGKVVNTNDLVNNIKSGKILGAALDVIEYEETSFEQLNNKQMPSAFEYITKSDKIILSPHIAGWTYESNLKHSEVIIRKIKEIIK